MLRFVCLLVDLIQGFCYSYLKLETAGLELAATITLVLQANRLVNLLILLQNGNFLFSLSPCHIDFKHRHE